MADDQSAKDRTATSAEEDSASTLSTEQDGAMVTGASDWSNWSNLWQVPAIVVSGVLIAGGIYVAMEREPDFDIDQALAEVEMRMTRFEFDEARHDLRVVIEPHLAKATQGQVARFHLALGDWFYFAQFARGSQQDDTSRYIDDQYGKAVELEVALNADRLERWGEVQLSLKRFDAVQDRIGDLARLGATDDAELRRKRLFRDLIEMQLRDPELLFADLMGKLTQYRAESQLGIIDEIWTVARMAELRLDAAVAGSTDMAVDHLLVDMRRIETRSALPDPAGIGELYMLLGRAYFDLGNPPYADANLNRALELLSEKNPARGLALIWLGRTRVATAEYESAFEFFDEAVREYPAMHMRLMALFGRAEVRSILGDNEGSLDDYAAVTASMLKSPSRHATPQHIASSLCDRHDAALAMGELETALRYAMTADALFAGGLTPSDVLLRVASTSEQLAVDALARDAALRAGTNPTGDPDPLVLRAAGAHLRVAGDYYIRHARSEPALASDDESWAESLWLGARSYERGGWYDLAVQHFLEYLGTRSTEDARRSQVAFHLARTYQASLDCASAIEHYESVIATNPRSTFASQSHVLLARCYIDTGQIADAKQELLQVLAGERNLDPAAVDYRDALIQLGIIYHDQLEFVDAIELLDEAAERYVDDVRRTEVLYRLGDSYRQHALALDEQLRDGDGIRPARRAELAEMMGDHLRRAEGLFGTVCDAAGGVGVAQPTLLERSFERAAFLLRADCAHALEDYERAIELYEDAARTFADHQSSMQALVQIIDCYERLGDRKRARTAHERAIARLRSLPEDAFAQPESLMDRAKWEQWLMNSPVGNARRADAAPLG